ncbi:hypothetical protein [Aquiflexum sp.]|uniref:hypothetical protein n=1 Tax=Aquiflexum sp. TaxID=1872584 RepID=UPI00359365F4
MKCTCLLIFLLPILQPVSGQDFYSKGFSFTPKPNPINLEFPTKNLGGSLEQLRKSNGAINNIPLDSAKSEEYKEKILLKMEEELTERSGLGEMGEMGFDPSFGEEMPFEIPAVDGSVKDKLNPKTLQEDFFTDRRLLENAMNDLDKKKKKFKRIEDSRYPEYAKKRNSLSDRKFSQRSELGLIASYIPSFGQVSGIQGQFGYALNSKLTAGSGLVLGHSDLSTRTISLTAIKMFSNIRVKENIFLLTEYYRSLAETKEIHKNGAEGKNLLMMGMGSDIRIYKTIFLRSSVAFSANGFGISALNLKERLVLSAGLVLSGTDNKNK